MMKSLVNQTKGITLFQEVLMATSFFQRGRGLLGKRTLPEGTTLWIRPSNNIHTMFMQFSIDAVFVNKDLKVVKVLRNIKPWKPVIWVWKAHSVFEFTTGQPISLSIETGDQLYVSS